MLSTRRSCASPRRTCPCPTPRPSRSPTSPSRRRSWTPSRRCSTSNDESQSGERSGIHSRGASGGAGGCGAAPPSSKRMTVTKVVLAKLSPTMEEGTIVKWSKKEGDPVKVGDVLAEIETDKANMEMEALGAGVLRKILVPAGGKAPVGNLIGVIANPDEDISAMVASAGGAAAAPAAAPQASPPPPPAPRAEPAAQAPAAPVAPQPAPAPQAAPQPAPNPPPAGAQAAEGEGGPLKASPLARSMAAQQNIPLSSVPGSGPGGRIIKRDIEAWSAGGQHAAAAPATAASSAPRAAATAAP